MKRGFTLLESVIAISLLGVVGLSFAYLFTMAQRFMIQSVNATSSQGDAAFALEHIKRHLMVATAIVTPAVGDPAGAELVFTWQPRAIDAVRTSRYVLDANGDLRFFPVADVGTGEVVSQGITTITFTRGAAGTPAAGTISINVTAQRTSGGDTRQMSLQTNVNPRGLFQ